MPWLIFGVLVEVVGALVLLQAARSSKVLWVVLGAVLYASSAILWVQALRQMELYRGLILFTVLNVLIGVLAAILFFDEQPDLQGILGVVLGLLSVLLLSS